MTDGGSPGFDNNSLDYVNKLRELQITVRGSPGYDNNYLDYVNKLREFGTNTRMQLLLMIR